jgi:dipeptidyl aminopeptidase/acylaminoacyl peptidase
LISTSPDWKHIVVKIEGSQFADDYFLFSDGAANGVFLTSGRPNIKSEDINPIGKVTFTARDNLKIPTLITIPRDKTAAMKDLPAVIYPHGGPQSHDTIGFDYIAQALASQGYLVIQPQFRGSDGFGWQHIKAGHGEWGKKMQDDLTDAVNFFAGKGYINPKKVCIVGASYGGYAALAGGAFTPEVYRCVVSINGVTDLNAMLNWSKKTEGKDSWIVDYWKTQFSDGNADKKTLEAISPDEFAEKFTAPTLLIHAENDKRVPFSQSSDMHSALKAKKKSVELIKLKGDNHHLLESETRLQALEATVNFVNKHLK